MNGNSAQAVIASKAKHSELRMAFLNGGAILLVKKTHIMNRQQGHFCGFVFHALQRFKTTAETRRKPERLEQVFQVVIKDRLKKSSTSFI